jgi:hypothetical protein
LNLALHYLAGAINFDPVVNKIDPLLASQIVWLDALLMNVDRTVRNTNLLMWQKELWLIDHGASLYFHHTWSNWEEQSLKPFVQIKDHVLLQWAIEIEKVDKTFRSLLTTDKIISIIGLVPDEWLVNESAPDTRENRKVYEQFLLNRISNSHIFVKEAQHARQTLI